MQNKLLKTNEIVSNRTLYNSVSVRTQNIIS
jgi:hypothetical protein